LCLGSRLKKESLSIYVGGKNIAEVSQMPVGETVQFVQTLKFGKKHAAIAEPILKEITARLNFLINVGLSYLSLSRSAATLSGGESQRIRLATQIGSNLVGVLYVLDEPSIGLHQRDNDKLIRTLEGLRDQGNSVLVVEHDEETITRADFVVDMGPGAGEHGGEILFSGSPDLLKKETKGLTGQYLSGKMKIEIPHQRRTASDGRYLKLIGAKQNNLKNISVSFPLGTLTCVTGVSGSGKSTLVIDTLLTALQLKLSGRTQALHQLDGVEGIEYLDKVIYVDQSPIGRTPRSNPATYTGLFTDIRALFAGLPEAKVRGYTAGRFSFNVEGGRCQSCSGDGNLKITMNFLPDVYVQCEVCRGARYNRETLDVHYRGKSIADILSMTVEQAALFFERVPQIRAKLSTLLDVGLGYLQVGQNAVTLSGGEAQRIKLAKELNRRATGRTIYILDEPTTGLHFEDVRKLVQILQTLVDHGNTVVVIEHNLDVIKQADYLIDLGIEGGKEGGQVLYQGAPEGLVKVKESYTGKYLKPILEK
jgi:excinuclease ABC subunit A